MSKFVPTYQRYVADGDLDAAAVILDEMGIEPMDSTFFFDPSKVTADWNGQVRVTPQVLWVDSHDDQLWEWQTPEPDDQPGRWLVEGYDAKHDGWFVYCDSDNEVDARMGEAGLLDAWTQITNLSGAHIDQNWQESAPPAKPNSLRMI